MKVKLLNRKLLKVRGCCRDIRLSWAGLKPRRLKGRPALGSGADDSAHEYIGLCGNTVVFVVPQVNAAASGYQAAEYLPLDEPALGNGAETGHISTLGSVEIRWCSLYPK